MKRILSIVLFIGLSVNSMFANGSNKPTELMNLPHPVKVIMPNIEKLKITKEQEKRLNKEMLEVFPEVIQEKMKKIMKLEKKISKNVLKDNKTKTQLSDMLNKLEKMKRDVTDIHIDALNVLADILTKEQMEQSLKMMEKEKLKGKSNKFRIDELILLPHPGKFIKQGKIELNKEQKKKLKVVKKTLVPKFQDKMRDAFKIEKKLRRAVEKAKPIDSLKSMIDEIENLKREAFDIRLEALYEIQKILTKEQWEKVNKLTYK